MWSCFRDNGAAYVGGRILLHDQDDLPITIQPLERRVEIPPCSFIRPGLIHGANFAFRKEALEAIAGFDPLLGAGTRIRSGDDIDAVARTSAAGYAGAYDPRPLVYHHHGRKNPRDLEALEAGYDLGRGAYFMKGLLDPRVRGQFVPPVLQRFGGHVVKRRFRILAREVAGVRIYLSEARSLQVTNDESDSRAD
jgi:GT2 family glycosyltransferase